jgi:hypothetical protein
LSEAGTEFSKYNIYQLNISPFPLIFLTIIVEGAIICNYFFSIRLLVLCKYDYQPSILLHTRIFLHLLLTFCSGCSNHLAVMTFHICSRRLSLYALKHIHTYTDANGTSVLKPTSRKS